MSKTWSDWEEAGIKNFVSLLLKRRDPYAAKPSISQAAFNAMPKSIRWAMTCNGGCGKPVSDQGMLCVECGIMVHEGTFPQHKKKTANEVTID